MQKKIHLDEISLVPSAITHIASRSQATPVYANADPPFFVAPMDTVIDATNCHLYIDNTINAILPRYEWQNIAPLKSQYFWFAVTLEEAKKLEPKLLAYLESAIAINGRAKTLIDIANGHMALLYEVGAKLKNRWGDQIELMAGNIANPKTIAAADGVFDWMRIGIGGGSRCLTSTKTGVHYPSASLILDTLQEREKMTVPTKIIMDGGISDIGTAVKALALGADGVMMGRLFNSCAEASCGSKIEHGDHTEYFPVQQKTYVETVFSTKRHDKKVKFYNYYRGMSTQEVQEKEGRATLKTPEGFGEWNPITHTLQEFATELFDSLRSSMSYCGKTQLEEYIGFNEFVTSNAKGHN